MKLGETEMTSSVACQLPRLFYSKRDLCQMLGFKVRTVERMISSGEIPPPSSRLRGRPVWLARVIHAWAEQVSLEKNASAVQHVIGAANRGDVPQDVSLAQ